MNNAGRQQFSAVDIRISYKSRPYSDTQQTITHAYIIDIYYKRKNNYHVVSIIDDADSLTFDVKWNEQKMVNPMISPLLLDDMVIKQLSNYMIAVTTPDFRVEFAVDYRIYVRLDPRFEKKVRTTWATAADVVS